MFFDLTAVDNTLCSTAALHEKLVALSQLTRNCNFTLTVGSGPQKRLSRLRNSIL